MSWERRNTYALVVKEFENDSPLQLRLRIGDLVIIRGESSGWYKGSVYINENNLRRERQKEEKQQELEEAKRKELQEQQQQQQQQQQQNQHSNKHHTGSANASTVEIPVKKRYESSISNRGFIPSTHVVLLEDTKKIDNRQSSRKSVIPSKSTAANAIQDTALGRLYSKMKKLDDFEFEKDKGELELHSKVSWWHEDLILPFCRLVCDAITDWQPHVARLVQSEENTDIFERVFDSLCKLASAISLYKRVHAEKNENEIAQVEQQAMKSIEQVCLIFGEDVIPKSRNMLINETNTPITKLFTRYVEAYKKEQKANEDLKTARIRKLKNEARSKNPRFPAIPFARDRNNNEKEDESEAKTDATGYYNLPDGNTQLLVQISDCVLNLGDRVEVLFTLFSKKEKRFVSEDFVVDLPKDNGVVSDDQLAKRRVVVIDLGKNDYVKDLYLVARVYRIGAMLKEKKDKKVIGSDYRRPFGVSLFELNPSIVSDLMSDELVHTDPLPVYVPSKEETFSILHEAIIEKSKDVDHTVASQEITKGVSFTLQSFMGDYSEVVEKNMELADLKTCRLMSFPEVISPNELRNDIYITLGQGNFKTSDAKNVIVEAKVIFKPGKDEKAPSKNPPPVKCITTAVDVQNDNNDEGDKFVSSVYYHNKAPKWNETFKLHINPEDLDRATVVFLFSNAASRHATSKPPFGIATWKVTDRKGLLNMTTKMGKEDSTGQQATTSSTYPLSVYKFSKMIEEEVWDFAEKHELRTKLATKSLVDIKINVVSTRVTQNENLRNLLHWQSVVKSKKDILDQFQKCEINDKVTFLREILAAMFSIMAEHDDKDMALLIYNSVTDIVGNLVSASKFARYKNILDEYVVKHFHSVHAQKWFLHYIIQNLNNMHEAAHSRSLGNTIKALDYFFKFIVVSRQQYEAAIQNGDKVPEEEILTIPTTEAPKKQQPVSTEEKKDEPQEQSDSDETKPTEPSTPASPLDQLQEEESKIPHIEPKNEFQKKVLYVLDKLYELLNAEEKFLIGAQGSVLKFIGSLFDSFADIFDEVQLGAVSATFLKNIPRYEKSALTVGKLQLISQMVKGKVFQQVETRKIVLPRIIEELQYHFNKEPSERHICIEIFAGLMQASQKVASSDIDAIKDSLYSIFTLIPHCKEAIAPLRDAVADLKKQAKAVQQEAVKKELEKNEKSLSTLMTSLLTLLHLYRAESLLQYHCERDEATASGMNLDTIKQFYYLQQVFLGDDHTIPKYFISFNIIMYKTVLENMASIAKILKLFFLEEEKFNFELWDTLYKNMFKFVFTPYLQLAKSPSFRRAKLNQSDDLRRRCLELMLEAWTSMGQMQQHFVPSIINPVMTILDIRDDSTLIKQIDARTEELHRAAVNVYYGILQQEYTKNKSLERSEGVTQRCIIERTVDDLFKRSFMQGLETKFKADSVMGPTGMEMLNRLNNMLDDVAKIQRYAHDEDLTAQSCIQVMESFLINGNIELYLKYVHILSKMHLKFQNYIEAALALKLHADRLTWDNTTKLQYFSDEYPEETSKARKERMYKKMIEHFNDGKDWERAIALCKELRELYERDYDYLKIEDLLKQEGSYYTSIMTKKRFGAAYFYVRYYGQGFKSLGLEGEFIYRGKELENHVDFANRLGAKYSAQGAKVLFKQPADDLDNDPGYFIYAYTVFSSDDREFNNIFEPRNYKISPKISKYARMNHIKYATSTRRYRESNEETKNEFKDMHREIKFFCLEDTFPNIRRRMRIVEIKYLNLSPLENAMKDIEDKVNELQDSVISHILDARPDTNELSMLLNGTIDAAVNGGIKKYLEAFFTPEFKDNLNEQEMKTLNRFRTALLEQVDVLKEGLYHRRKHVTGMALALNDHLEKEHEKLKVLMSGI